MIAKLGGNSGDIVYKKIDEIFSSMHNVVSMNDHILIASFDEQGKDHDATFNKVLRICRQTSLKLNKGKCLFRCTSITFFGRRIFWQDVNQSQKNPSPSSYATSEIQERIRPMSG